MSSAVKSLVFKFTLLARDASSCEVKMVIWEMRSMRVSRWVWHAGGSTDLIGLSGHQGS